MIRIGSDVMTKYGAGVVFQTNGDYVWVWLRDLDASPYSSTYEHFASLRDMVYAECPCGCGSKEICEAQRARVKAHNDAIPF
jgi:hypothetical protein